MYFAMLLFWSLSLEGEGDKLYGFNLNKYRKGYSVFPIEQFA